MWKKYYRAGQAADDNTAREHCTLDTYGYKNTLRICNKGKAVPLQAWSGLEGSRKLRFPDYMTTAQDGCKVCPPYAPAAFTPENAPGTDFC
jgi:hypothetical protein